MFDQKLKMKIQEQSHLYDFRYISQNFAEGQEVASEIYLSAEDLMARIRSLQVQGSAE